MKLCFVAASIAFAVSVFGQGQQIGQGAPREIARFVSEHANEVSWSHDQSFLGYDFKETNGHISSFGLYDLANNRGKTLLTANSDEKFQQPVWLAGSPVELVWSTQKIMVSNKKGERLSLWALDGRKFVATKLWFDDFPEEQGAKLSVEESPLLTHAIVTLNTHAGKRYYVVTLGAQDIVISEDISAAIQQGQGFAGWTVDGTAFFGGGSKDDLSGDDNDLTVAISSLLTQALTNGQSAGTNGSTVVLQLNGDLAVDTGGSIVLRLVPSHTKPEIASGTVGLELVPSNGVLRQVRFNGYWKDQEQPPTPTLLLPQDHTLTYRSSTSGTRALWLTPNEKDPRRGVLVSPQAELSWLLPDGKTVAFTVNGVLFVKTVQIETR